MIFDNRKDANHKKINDRDFCDTRAREKKLCFFDFLMQMSINELIVFEDLSLSIWAIDHRFEYIIFVTVCRFGCHSLSVCLSVCRSVGLSLCLFVCLCVYLWTVLLKNYWSDLHEIWCVASVQCKEEIINFLSVKYYFHSLILCSVII